MVMKKRKAWELLYPYFAAFLFKWILLFSAREWKECNLRKFPRKWKQMIYLFDCISVDKWRSWKKWKESDFLRSFFYMCSWKVLVLDRKHNFERHWSRFRICTRLTRKREKNSHLVVFSFSRHEFQKNEMHHCRRRHSTLNELKKLFSSVLPGFASSHHSTRIDPNLECFQSKLFCPKF